MGQDGDGSQHSLTLASKHAADAERSIVGGCLLGGRPAMDDAIEANLRPGDFGNPRLALMWTAMLALHQRGSAVSAITLVDELVTTAKIDDAGGAAAVAQLEALLPTSAHVGPYSRIVIEAANLRRIAEAAHIVQRMAIERDGTAAEILADAQAVFLALNRRAADDLGIVDRRATVDRVLAKASSTAEDQALPTGFPDLDSMLRGGLRQGSLYVIAARPGVGKSAFGLQIASHVADHHASAALLSLEMTGDEVIEREIAAKSRQAYETWRRRDEAARVAAAGAHVAERPLHIIDRAGLDVAGMSSRIRRLVARDGVGLVVVDYVGLVRSGDRYKGDKNNEVAEVTAALKELAMNLRIPVVVLSQLNRGLDKRQDKRPILSDLRDSGAIEQDANVVIFLYREEYHSREECPDDERGVCEVIVAKNRNGATGTVELMYDGPTTRFIPMARRDQMY